MGVSASVIRRVPSNHLCLSGNDRRKPVRFVSGFRLTRLGVVVCAYLLAALVTGAAARTPPLSGQARPPGYQARRVGGRERQRLPQTRALVPAPPGTPLFTAQDRVGAVFSLTGRRHHFCTGSVVDSPHRNLVITAAHCVHGGAGGDYRAGLAFAPGFRGGTAPAGMWQVRSIVVAPGWAQTSDISADVAFLVLEPLDGRNVQDVVGGNPLGVDRTPGPVRLVGYPSTADSPVSCGGTVEQLDSGQLRVYCPGMSSGTSGGPWLADAEASGAGSVVGVIGGYESGGTSADVSYSSPFGQQVAELYRQAGESP